MTFLEFMQVMFDLREKFPGMTWDVAHFPGDAESTVTVHLPVSDENARLLRQARQMFAPAGGA